MVLCNMCIIWLCACRPSVILDVHVYSNNYRPNEKRGGISGNLILSSADEGATALVIGLILDLDLGYFKFIAFGTFFLGYWVLINLGPGAVSWVSATLIMLGCVIFVIIPIR